MLNVVHLVQQARLSRRDREGGLVAPSEKGQVNQLIGTTCLVRRRSVGSGSQPRRRGGTGRVVMLPPAMHPQPGVERLLVRTGRLAPLARYRRDLVGRGVAVGGSVAVVEARPVAVVPLLGFLRLLLL